VQPATFRQGGNQRSRVENSKANGRWASRSMSDLLELRALLFHRDVVFPEPAAASRVFWPYSSERNY
jgi:hypothetical protein